MATAMEVIHETQLTWNDMTTQIKITAEYDENVPAWQANDVNVVADLVSGETETRFAVRVPAEGDLTLALPTIAPQTICLIACGVGALIRLVLKCRTRDIRQFIQCMKEHGVDVGLELAACVLKCFAHP